MKVDEHIINNIDNIVLHVKSKIIKNRGMLLLI